MFVSFLFWKHEVIIEIELKRITQMDRTNSPFRDVTLNLSETSKKKRK